MRPSDFGPIYAETIMGRFPVEPWNTGSNLLFLLLIIYLVYRTRLDFRRYALVVGALPILSIGFVGGTIFHATRSANLWLRMDFIPIFILSLLVAFYFWRELLGGSVRAVIVTLVLFLVIRAPWYLEEYFGELAISFKIGIAYSGLAVALILPAIFLSARSGWLNLHLLLAAIASFSCGIVCRTIDSGLGAKLLPMGTHFLWHIFGATSVYFMFEYVLRRYDHMRLSPAQKPS